MTAGAVDDQLLGARHHPLPHRDVTRVGKELGPVGLDVPVGEDEQRAVTGIPDPAVAPGQLLGQRLADGQSRQFTQEMLQGEVPVGETV